MIEYVDSEVRELVEAALAVKRVGPRLVIRLAYHLQDKLNIAVDGDDGWNPLHDKYDMVLSQITMCDLHAIEEAELLRQPNFGQRSMILFRDLLGTTPLPPLSPAERYIRAWEAQRPAERDANRPQPSRGQ